MRSRSQNDDFFLIAAKKKPHWQALIEQLNRMTLEQIEGPSEPLWVRQALSKLKTSSGVSQSQRVQEIVNRVIAAEAAAAALPQKTYEVRLWSNPSEFFGTEINGQRGTLPHWQIEIVTGDVLIIIDDHYIKVGDSMIQVNSKHMKKLIMQSKLVGYMTIQQYQGFKQALLNQRHKL